MQEQNYNLPAELQKRFTILNWLGAGGSGKVLKAKDEVLDTIVAIKVLNYADDPRQIVRLQREATVLGKLKHENITQVIDFNVIDNTPYIITEYIEGKTLDTLLAEEELSLEHEIEIASQISQALQYAHEHGVIHRDIKPENIMVVKGSDKSILVKILDFGLAKVQGEEQFLTTSGAFVGTPLYASPEQIRGKKADSKSDLYSFGCLLFFLFLKKQPFEADTTLEVTNLHLNAPCPEFNHEQLTFAVKDFIEKCLSKEPENRPDSASDFASALEDEDGSIESPDIPAPSNHNYLPILIAVVLLGLIGTSIVIVSQLQKQEASQPKKKPQKNQIDYVPIPKGLEDSIGKDNGFTISPNEKGKRTAYIQKFTDDESFKTLRDKNFQVLSLWHSATINGEGFKYIKDKNIINLVLSKSTIPEENLKYVAELKSLRHLSMSPSNNYSDRAIKNLLPLTKLQSLTFTSSKLTNKGLEYATAFKHLNYLVYGGSKEINDQCIDSLRKFKRLSTLGLPYTSITAKTIAYIAKNKKIVSLNLAGNDLKDKRSIDAIVKLNPYELDISNTNISDKNLGRLAKANKIQKLDVSGTKITAKGIMALKRIPYLTELSLTSVPITSKMISAITNQNLKGLTLARTNLNEEHLKQLVSMKSLYALNINECYQLKMETVRNFKNAFVNQNKHELIITHEPSSLKKHPSNSFRKER